MTMQTIRSSYAMAPRQPRRRRLVVGFTLVEMLVVIGIIVLLIAIALPVLIAARRSAVKSRMAMDIQTIATALNTYKQDCGDYPRSALVNFPTGITQTYQEAQGSGLLGRALISPDPIADGAPGPGFRIRSGTGQVYGPYLPPDKFKCQVCLPNDANGNPMGCQILDMNGMPILYSPARIPPPPLNTTMSYGGSNDLPFMITSANALFWMPAADINQFCVLGESGYNTTTFTGAYISPNTDAIDRIQMILGDFTTNGQSTNFNGVIDAGETPATTGPFILWSAGPDGRFGFPNGASGQVPVANDLRNCDDATNFTFGPK